MALRPPRQRRDVLRDRSHRLAVAVPRRRAPPIDALLTTTLRCRPDRDVQYRWPDHPGRDVDGTRRAAPRLHSRQTWTLRDRGGCRLGVFRDTARRTTHRQGVVDQPRTTGETTSSLAWRLYKWKTLIPEWERSPVLAAASARPLQPKATVWLASLPTTNTTLSRRDRRRWSGDSAAALALLIRSLVRRRKNPGTLDAGTLNAPTLALASSSDALSTRSQITRCSTAPRATRPR